MARTAKNLARRAAGAGGVAALVLTAGMVIAGCALGLMCLESYAATASVSGRVHRRPRSRRLRNFQPDLYLSWWLGN